MNLERRVQRLEARDGAKDAPIIFVYEEDGILTDALRARWSSGRRCRRPRC